MKFGKTIQELRKQKNISQDDFSKLCGISKNYLSQIENNRKNPTIEVLENISKHLKVPFGVISFLSIDTTEIDQEKREAYKIMAPAINAMIRELFLKGSDSQGG